MKKFLLALLLLMPFAFAGQNGGTSGSQFAPYERVEYQFIPGVFYNSTTIPVTSIFGDLKTANFTNLGGSDALFTLFDENGSTIWAKNVTAQNSFYNRSIGYTNYGTLTLGVTNAWTNGGSMNANLVSWLKLDARNSTTGVTADVYALNNATAVNSTLFPGKVGNATAQNGTTSYIVVNNSASLNNTNASFTIAFWLNSSGVTTGNTAYLTHLGNLTGNQSALDAGFSARAVNNSQLSFLLNLNESQVELTYYSFGCLNNSAWTHWAFTMNATNASIIKNGVTVASTGFADQIVNVTPNNLYFGDGYNATNASRAYYAPFQFDEVYVFTDDITASQAAYLYNQNKVERYQATVISKR